MANAKDVHIIAWVPYNWASELTPVEGGIMAAWFLAPTGLKLRYDSASRAIPIPGSTGRMTMYRVHITGIEAVWHATLRQIRAILERQRFAEIVLAQAWDIDNGDLSEIEAS